MSPSVFLSRTDRCQKGSLLLVSFFFLLILSIFTIAVGYTMRQKIQLVSRLEARQKLRLIGEAAVKKSIYIRLNSLEENKKFDALGQPWSSNEPEFRAVTLGDGVFTVSYPVEVSYRDPETNRPVIQREVRYGMVDEESKINLNRVRSTDVLQRLLGEVTDLDRDGARALTDAIFDWKDNDDDPRANGAESRYYRDLKLPSFPRNGKLVTLQELRQIKGMTEEVYQRMLPYVTLESKGVLNLNTASRPVLIALGLSSSLCDKIIAYRLGRDGIERTLDDKAFDALSSVEDALRLDEPERAEIAGVIQSGVLTTKSSCFSVNAEARLKYGRQVLKVWAVFDNHGEIKKWEEQFVTLPA